MNHLLKNQAEELATKLDNPASVMIRKLWSHIEELYTWNESYSSKFWEAKDTILKLEEECAALREQLNALSNQ